MSNHPTPTVVAESRKQFLSIWLKEGGKLVNKDCCEDPRREYKVYILANLNATRYLTPSTLNLK